VKFSLSTPFAAVSHSLPEFQLISQAKVGFDKIQHQDLNCILLGI